MKFNEFERIANGLLNNAKTTLISKNKEYADTTDVFHNFDVARDILQHLDVSSPAGSGMAFAVKHLVSIIDIINNPSKFNDEIINEKFGDMINYLILIRGMLK